MTVDDGRTIDPAPRDLRTYDVSQRRSRQLAPAMSRHAAGGAAAEEIAVDDGGAPFRRVIVPALGGAWCLAYLVEIVRRTAAIYGYFGTQ